MRQLSDCGRYQRCAFAAIINVNSPPGDLSRYAVEPITLTMTDGMLQSRPLELSDDVRRLLLKLRKLSNVTADPAISANQIRSVEEELGCTFPDPVVAAFANGDDALYEQYGVKIEDVVCNTTRAHGIGHPVEKIAIGCHPDDHCFYCVAKQSPSPTNPGITEYDNFDGSSRFFTLLEWLGQLVADEIDFKETNPTVTDDELNDFIPSLT